MAAPTSNPWVYIAKPNPRAPLRLFCFNYAGGGASIFRTWSNYLPADVEICSIQLPGRENRLAEPAFRHIDPLIEALTRAILPYLNKPFAFFGHSMGTLVSFDLTRQLRRQRGPQPLQMLVSAHRAPHLPDPDPPIHELPQPQFIAELSRLNGTPRDILEHAELMEVMSPLLRADFAVCETYPYREEEPLDCPISAYGGLQDKDISRQELEAWREHTRKSFKLTMFDGDHFFLHSSREPLLQMISEEMKRLLTRMRYM